MPHSTVCCLSAFEIGVSESGREGGGHQPVPLTYSSFLALRRIALTLFASVASGAAMFFYMLIFSCFIILSLSRYQKPSTSSGNVSFSRQLGCIWPGRALPPLLGAWVLFGVQRRVASAATSPEMDLGKADPFPEVLRVGSELRSTSVNRDFP